MMLKYTRHPFVDAGVAAAAAFSQKSRPEEVDRRDLEELVEYISKHYPRKPASSFVQLAFTINAVYTQPAVRDVEKREADSRAFLQVILERDSHSSDEKCGFCGRDALKKEIKAMKQVSGPITRQHVPLIIAKGIMNFFPTFSSLGVPICGNCLFAIQAMPLGAGSCGGRLLVVHSDDGETNLHFARRFIERHQRNFQLADLTKYPAERFPRTILIDELLEIVRRREDEGKDSARYGSITAYHFTNYGTNADIDMYHLPHQTVEFLRIARSGKYAQVWNNIARRGWQQVEDARAGVARNFLYEDLFFLPERTAHFIRVYFLRRGVERAFKDDPRREYALEQDLELISWDLTEMFLRKVVGMEAERREAIKKLGDRLSSYVQETNAKRFFGNFYRSDKYGELRGLLIKASNDEVRRGKSPIVGFDEFVTIFEDGEELPRIDWRLARDLVLIRMIEQLREWLSKNKEALPEDAPENQAVES